MVGVFLVVQQGPTTVFTDAMSLLTNLGVQSYVTGGIQALIVIGISAALLRFIR